MSFEEELHEHFKNTKLCACCNDRFEPENSDNNHCDFCCNLHMEILDKLENRKKNETEVDYKIRLLLFEKTKNLSKLFTMNAPEVVISSGFYLLIYYYQISEYNHCLEFKDQIKTNDLVDTLNEVLECYYENKENELPLLYEKFKTHVFQSKYSESVKKNLKTMNKKNYSAVHNFCLDCGEFVEDYMQNNYCQACTMLDQAIGDDLGDLE